MQAWTMVSEKNFNQEIDLWPLCSESNVSHRSESENFGCKRVSAQAWRNQNTCIYAGFRHGADITRNAKHGDKWALKLGINCLKNICRISTKTYFSFKSPYTSPKFVEFKFGENNNKKNFKVTNTCKLQALSWNIFYKNSIKFHYYVLLRYNR